MLLVDSFLDKTASLKHVYLPNNNPVLHVFQPIQPKPFWATVLWNTFEELLQCQM